EYANLGGFFVPPSTPPHFTQNFPTLIFNPPSGLVPGQPGDLQQQEPMVNVATDVNGTFTGLIPVGGNGYQPGVGGYFVATAVFTGAFLVREAGDVVLSIHSDDGFILGIGNGATRVSGPMDRAPASGLTAFESFPVMGAHNQGATANPPSQVTVHL